MKIAQKREREKEQMAKMIRLYCRGKRHPADGSGLCQSCGGLLAYAQKRIEHCPHMADKTFCSKCPTPCYSAEMRTAIRQVMRYSGPRMLLYSPVLVLQHVLDSRRKTKK